MLFLATGAPSARPDENEQIIATIPSGHGAVQVSMDFHGALALKEAARRVVYRMLDGTRRRPAAEVILFRPKSKRRRQRKTVT